MTNKVGGMSGKGFIFRETYSDKNYRVGHEMSIAQWGLHKDDSLEDLKYQTKNEDGKWEDIKFDDLPDYVQDEVLKEEI